jgi:hypothetical protein
MNDRFSIGGWWYGYDESQAFIGWYGGYSNKLGLGLML